MTVPTSRAPVPDTRPTSPSGREMWRSARVPLLIGLGLLLVATVSVVAGGRTPTGYLEPDAANPTGSRALAMLLKDRGVTIESVSTVQGAQRATGPGDLLLVAQSSLLSKEQLRSLARLPGDRLLIEPNGAALRTLAPRISQTGSAPVRARDASCDLRGARLAGAASMGGHVYRVQGGPRWRCYPAAGSPSLVRTTRDGQTVTVVGTARPFTNEYLDEHGNAALTMNLVGSSSTVVWLVPDPLAAGSSQQRSLRELVPSGVWFAVAQLAVAVAFLALWRVRRLGPVVTEPLPVVVRAAETVEGRARLYRSRRARDRAAQALRAGSRSRIAAPLGLSADAEPQAVTETVAARIGRPAPDVGALLYGSAPEDDAALVRLADDLDALETEVRRP